MVVVYFETPNHSFAEIVAVFQDEEMYDICFPALEEKAKECGMVITEACELTKKEAAERLIL